MSEVPPAFTIYPGPRGPYNKQCPTCGNRMYDPPEGYEMFYAGPRHDPPGCPKRFEAMGDVRRQRRPKGPSGINR